MSADAYGDSDARGAHLLLMLAGVAVVFVLLTGSIVLLLLIAPPAPVSNIHRSDLIGTWRLEEPKGHNISLLFRENGEFVSTDWPAQLGCAAWPEGLMLGTFSWSRRDVLSGRWDPYLGSSQIALWPVTSTTCQVSPTFTLDRNVITGDSFLSVYLDGFDQEDDRLTFVRVE